MDGQSGGGEAAATQDVTGAEPTAEGSAPSSQGDAPEAAPALAPKYKLNVYGEEREVDEAEIVKLAQKAAGADRRYEQAAQAMKRAEAIAQRVQADPVLRAYLSGDQQAFMDAVIEQMEYQALPPEERRRRDDDRTTREKARRYEEFEKQQQQQQIEHRAREDASYLAQQATVAFEKFGLSQNDPDFDYALERWAGEMLAAEDAGVKLSPLAAAKRVADRITATRETALSRLEKMSDDELLAELDRRKITDRVRRADAARLQRNQTTRNARPVTQPRPTNNPPREVSTGAYLKAISRGQDPSKLFEE